MKIPEHQRLAILVDTLAGGQHKVFAETIGVAQNTFSNYVNGKSKIPLNVFEAIKDFYPQVSDKWLLSGEGELFANGAEVYVNSAGKNNNGVQQNGKNINSKSDDDKDKKIAFLEGQVQGLQIVVDKLLSKDK